jgi:hypothetical protein
MFRCLDQVILEIPVKLADQFNEVIFSGARIITRFNRQWLDFLEKVEGLSRIIQNYVSQLIGET